MEGIALQSKISFQNCRIGGDSCITGHSFCPVGSFGPGSIPRGAHQSGHFQLKLDGMVNRAMSSELLTGEFRLKSKAAAGTSVTLLEKDGKGGSTIS